MADSRTKVEKTTCLEDLRVIGKIKKDSSLPPQIIRICQKDTWTSLRRQTQVQFE